MAYHTMRTPPAWVDEVADALLAGIPVPPPLVVPLTYRLGLPDRLAQADTSLREVTSDLEAGFVSERRAGGEYYVLRASRFDVFIHTQLEADALVEGIELPLAVITKVAPRQGLPRHGPQVRGAVTAHPPYDVARCDIAAVHERAQLWLRYERAVRTARDKSARLLTHRTRSDTAHADLHAQVRRHFSALQQMIELLQQRSETAGTRQARGVICVPPGAYPDTFCVTASERDDDFGGELTVQIYVAGQRDKWNLELVAVEDNLFHLTLPQDARRQEALVPGAAVELTYKPRFGLGRHSYALSRFLQEEVEGDWDALAQMVSAPETMWVPDTLALPKQFFDEDLNEDQRKAVAGALHAPHAFFIQGPPGTGKTTVISEIVRQLIARGERVLLLAPMHVAVDEVLQRVGDAPGVLALRASWDDSKVHEDVRRFTKNKLTAEFLRKARQPDAARTARWRGQAGSLRAEREAIEAAIAAGHAAGHAEAARSRAIALRDYWRTSRQGALAQARQRQDAAAQAELAAQARLGEVERAAYAAAQALDEAESVSRTFFQRVGAALGMGELARLRDARGAAEHEVPRFRQARDQAAAWSAEQAAALQRLGRDARAQEEEQSATCAQAAAGAAEARQRLAALRGRLGSLGSASDADLGERARQNHYREDRLDRLAYLEQRWFQLTGLADAGSAADHQRVVSDLGDQLIGAANLVCCTTTGFGGDKDLRDADYDTLIVDEASRVIDSEFLIGAKQARRWVLVGDEHQLPPFVDPADEYHLHALAALHMVERGAVDTLPEAVAHLSQLWKEDEELHQFRDRTVEDTTEQIRASGQWRKTYRPSYQKAYERLRQDNPDAERELLSKMRHHLVQSIFDRCVTDSPDGLRSSLVEQHRMIDPIAALVREPVYGGRYLSPPPGRQKVTRLVTSRTFPQPVVFLDTSGHPRAGETREGTGCYNKLEAEWVETACRAWDHELAARGESEVTVSVLTFYKAQARLIRKNLGSPTHRGFGVLRFKSIDTIDRLQGQQSDLVLISFCRTRLGQGRASRYGLWLQDVRRLNVACTRARRAIVLVGHRQTLSGLHDIAAAEAFYAHMFGLFSSSAPGTVLLKQLDRPDR